MDICKDKNFIDLRNKVHLHEKKGEIQTIIDSKDNIWLKDIELSSGTTGRVVIFKSQYEENSDLVIKYFYDSENSQQDMEHEINIIKTLNKSRCSNLINIGYLSISKVERVVIMEKLDGDLLDFDFSVFSKPLKLYKDLIEFLTSSSLCVYKTGKLYLDLKLENIGFKICPTKVKFTFLDFGSFFDIDDGNVVSTYIINQNKFQQGYFTNEVIFVYGFIMTLLNVRLFIKSKKLSEKFIDYHVSKISNEKKYKSDLLSESNYNRIKKRFYSYLDTKERFINFLFSQLERMTRQEPDVREFLKEVSNHNNY
tara:strand:+ start:893 stop:1822 length:930 start_codon:yes stop_codon:yes gene_type:complete